MSSKVLSVLIKIELGVDLEHGRLGGIHVLPGLGVVLLQILNVEEEVAETTLLEDPHEVGVESLLVVSGHFGDFPGLVHVAAFDRLELEVASDARVDEQLDELPVGHQELRDQVDVPLTGTTSKKFRTRIISGLKLDG